MLMTSSRLCWTVACAGLCLFAAAAVGGEPAAPAPATQPAAAPELRVSLYVLERSALGDRDLDKLTEKEISQISPGPAGQFRVPLKGPNLTTLKVGQRVPLAAASEESGRSGIRVNYEQAGYTAAAGGTWDPATRTAEIQLDVTVSLPRAGEKSDRRTARPSFKQTFKLKEGAPERFQLAGVGGEAESPTVNLVVAELSPVRARPGAETAPAAVSSALQKTRIEFQAVQVSGPASKLAGLDDDALRDAQPGIAELLERLSAFGSPRVLVDLTDTFDMSAGYEITAGQRVPTVQNVVRGRRGVTPSVTYEEVGAILRLKGSEWQERGDLLVCEPVTRIDLSGLGESGVQVTERLTLPMFTQVRHEGTRTLTSGTAEYIVTRGMAYPPGETSPVPVHVVRLKATRLAR